MQDIYGTFTMVSFEEVLIGGLIVIAVLLTIGALLIWAFMRRQLKSLWAYCHSLSAATAELERKYNVLMNDAPESMSLIPQDLRRESVTVQVHLDESVEKRGSHEDQPTLDLDTIGEDEGGRAEVRELLIMMGREDRRLEVPMRVVSTESA